ncbi:hypothetical protein ABZ249_12175 [Nocardiopsis sp. NPDC006139]|uniref:hypothetical protein n=1 Tax=Nocardiopsis sp. NPDC006139 TaxID=3154578 RepID=UPI0033B9FB47
MATPDESLNFVHELPSSFPGVDDDDWERAARLALAAMLVTAHRAGVHISHARFLDLTDTFHRFRSMLRADPFPEPVLALMLASAQQTHAAFLDTRCAGEDAENVREFFRAEVATVLSRYPLDLDAAHSEAAPIVRDNTDLINTVAQYLKHPYNLSSLHITALADPTRPDPAPSTLALARADEDWLTPHTDTTVLTALPRLDGELTQVVEHLLPSLATYADLLSAVPAHQLHWPLAWGVDLSEEATGTLKEALDTGVRMADPVPVTGRVRLLRADHPCEVGLYLNEHTNGMGHLADLAFQISNAAREPRSRIHPTATAHLALARCHTPGLSDGLTGALGTVNATVEFRSLAVVRMRFDDRASICRWQVLAESEL